jgi:hypothetical protein
MRTILSLSETEDFVAVYASCSGDFLGHVTLDKQSLDDYRRHCERYPEGAVLIDDWCSEHPTVTDNTIVYFD